MRRIEMALPGVLKEVAGSYDIRSGSVEAGQLDTFLMLLEKWNHRVNLTSSSRAGDLVPLVEESLWAAQVYRRRKRGDRAWKHLDIGTGSGFPAVPLKIVNPSLQLTLLESRERKAFFLERVVRDLCLEGVQVYCRRLSDYLGGAGTASEWDTVSWKAIRLQIGDWERLLQRATQGTEFWVFHGEDLPVMNPEAFRQRVRVVESLQVPHRSKSYLSIFQ
jgi:16S rRNA (guanine(527)-N(7))-methyltransferase RsmG